MASWLESLCLMTIVLACIIIMADGFQRKRKKDPKQIENIIISRSYSRQDPPLEDGATEVKLGIYINRFYSISEQTMDYSVSVYLRQAWNDPRLVHDSEEKTGKTKLEAGWKKIWVPDTFFRNEKKSSFHTVTVENRMASVTSNGDVWYVMKISATLSCPMTLQKYPMDTQICPMIFESFGYTVDTVRLSWLNNPVDIDVEEGMKLPQYTYENHELHDCSQNLTTGGSVVSCLQIDFILRRDLGYYFIQLFVPSILIVILSWVSFWINVDAAPARVSLGLLTVLTMTNHSIGINANLPRVSYIKAVDVWMSSCLLFVFAALCEFAFVNVATRHRVIAKAPPPHPSGSIPLPAEEESKNCGNCFQTKPRKVDREETTVGGILMMALPSSKLPKPLENDGKGRARSIDKIARKSFPLAFILFNIVYWVGYTYKTD